MTALDRAKRWLETGVKATALVVVPLASASDLSRAKAGTVTIFDPTSAYFSAASGGASQATTGFGSLPLFDSVMGAQAYGNAQYDVSGISYESISFVFAGGAGAGSAPFAVSTVPVSWDFTFTPSTHSDPWSYSVSTTINDTPTEQDFGPFVGQATIGDSMIAATPLGMSLDSWRVIVQIDWQSASGGPGSGILNWDIPAGQSLDINPAGAVPEPASLWLMIAALPAGLAMFLRRRRGRSSSV